MTKSITPQDIFTIKAAAKRLKKFIPERKHTELLDISAYQFSGVKSFRDAQIRSSVTLESESTSKQLPHKELSPYTPPIYPKFQQGDWYFDLDERQLIFKGEFSPYVINLEQLSDSIRMTDMILQIQKKKWLKTQIEGTNVSPTYQVDEFITLIDHVCHHFFNKSIQGVFSPNGNFTKVAWPEFPIRKEN
jgi:hypothetical protein